MGQERGRGPAGLRRGVVFALLVACGAVVASVLAGATPGAALSSAAASATAAAGPPELAQALSSAIAQTPGLVTGANLDEYPPGGNPAAVSTQSLGSFPTAGPSYAIMTTGDASLAGQTGFASVNAGGGNVRGNTDRDVTVLRIDLAVPAGANCLTFDFRFLSEEFPDFVGKSFNDAFIAELDQSTWTTEASQIIAPNNFAFDSQGNVISINALGFATMSAPEAAGTIYGGATRRLSASTPVTPGAHSLFLSIFDQGDSAYDSAVFVDRLVVGTASPGGCVAGATALSAAIAADAPESTAGATNGYTVTVSNSSSSAATLSSISVLLPAGFSYVPGSTTGATTGEPTIDGQMLSWSGTFPVAGDASTSLHFNVVVSSTPGTYTAEASAAGTGVSVTPSGPSAPITVTEPPVPADLTVSIAADQAQSAPGATNGYTVTISNLNPEQESVSSISAHLPAGFSYVSGSTTGATTEDPSADGQVLAWSGTFPVAGEGSTSLHFQVVVSSTPGTYTAEANASGEGLTITPSGPSAPITVTQPGGPPASPAPEPPPTANLILTLFASSATAAVGDPIGFAGNVTNHGPGPANDVTVTGTVSATVQLGSASTGAGPCAVSGNAFTCSIGTLLAGGSVTVNLTGTVVAGGGVLATMSADAAQTDPDESNNSASATIASPPPPPGVFLPPTPELPPPVRGVAVNVTPLRGIVLVNGVRLRDGEQIPVGAIVDTRRGQVRLQSANGNAAFKDGLFRIVESAGGTFTELRLLGGNFLRGCGHPARLLASAGTHRKKVVRRLWGNGTGNFRTSGRFSSATIRGTIWLTADRCDGTLTKVVRGRVSVFDFAKGRRILVGPGQSYLARAPK